MVNSTTGQVKSKATQLRIINLHKDAFNEMANSIKIPDHNKPMSGGYDTVYGLSNAYSMIAYLVLYLYSMEIG